MFQLQWGLISISIFLLLIISLQLFKLVTYLPSLRHEASSWSIHVVRWPTSEKVDYWLFHHLFVYFFFIFKSDFLHFSHFVPRLHVKRQVIHPSFSKKTIELYKRRVASKRKPYKYHQPYTLVLNHLSPQHSVAVWKFCTTSSLLSPILHGLSRKLFFSYK